MAEKCGGDVIFTVEADQVQIAEVLPDPIVLYTQGALISVAQNGVYILDNGPHRIVGIKGPCPNFKKGECTFGAPCPINALIFKE